MFSNFSKELNRHPGPGYHITTNKYEIDFSRKWFAERRIIPSKSYLEFLQEFGAGRYFGGSLVIFPLDHDDLPSVTSTTDQLRQLKFDEFFAFGYDGTTQGCYCLRRSGSPEIVWFTWDANSAKVLDQSFESWIEKLPKALFDEKIYKGYKPVKDFPAIRQIEAQRSAFKVKLISFDKDLTRPPGKENDFLPRYNRIVLSVLKTREVPLSNLTIIIRRVGSSIGKDNMDCLTINTAGMKVGVEQKIEGFVFDPFNVPFEDIKIDFNSEIDMGTPMRIQFAEIKDFL